MERKLYSGFTNGVGPPGAGRRSVCHVLGRFSGAGGQTSLGFARWGCESPICYADCDESTGLGTLDLFDFLCFQNSFVTGDACNCDTSTGQLVCDLFDFLCFQNAFVGGCS